MLSSVVARACVDRHGCSLRLRQKDEKGWIIVSANVVLDRNLHMECFYTKFLVKQGGCVSRNISEDLKL